MLEEALLKIPKVYLACGHTDMRKSIDGLVAIVSQNFKLDPFQNAVFLFCGKRADRIKILYWEGDGFLLLYKRIEDGRFQWPRSEEEVRQINEQELRLLLYGLSMDQPKAIRKLYPERAL